MENLACALFVFAVYCLWACASRPTVNTAADPAAPVDYFPEVEEVTEEEEEAIAVEVEVKPAAEVTVKPAKETAKKPPVAVPTDLSNLSIRQLKKLASAAKIKRYSNLTKAQLIQALAPLEVGAVARKAA